MRAHDAQYKDLMINVWNCLTVFGLSHLLTTSGLVSSALDSLIPIELRNENTLLQKYSPIFTPLANIHLELSVIGAIKDKLHCLCGM